MHVLIDIFPSHEELPTPLWDMLLNRCPNLTELTICSFSASHRLFAVNRVTEGRWPALSSLTLGAFGYNSDFTLATLPATPFASFLDAHPTLTYLRLAWNFKRWMSPDDTIDLPLPPTLDAFSGIAQQLPVGGCNSLTTLDLMCEPLYSARAPALRTVLRALPLLTSLELWVHVPEPRAGHEAFFRELWASVPGLEDLHFMCTTAFGKVGLFFYLSLHCLACIVVLLAVCRLFFLILECLRYRQCDLQNTNAKLPETAHGARARAAPPPEAAHFCAYERPQIRGREHATIRAAHL